MEYRYQKERKEKQVSTGEKFLFNLNKAILKDNSTKVDGNLQEKLEEYAKRILEKRRKKNFKNKDDSEDSKEEEECVKKEEEIIEEWGEESLDSSSIGRKNRNQLPLKPYHKKLIHNTFTAELISEQILDFFEINELLTTRRISKAFFEGSNLYLEPRLHKESNWINTYLDENPELNSNYMTVVDTQIPIALDGWLELDLNKILGDMRMTRADITAIKSIKNFPANRDLIFAPFCILYGLAPVKTWKADGSKSSSWHAAAIKMINLSNFANLHFLFDKDCIGEDIALEAFEVLNSAELRYEEVRAFNSALAKLLKWAQSAVAYHIVTHPYKVRNFGALEEGSDVFNFAAKVDSMMEKFYSFKSFLIKCGKLPIDINVAFNLEHLKFQKKVETHVIKQMDESIITKILLFLPAKEANSFSIVNKEWHFIIQNHWDYRLSDLVVEIETMKFMNLRKFLTKIPSLYENGFFSSFVNMFDDILYSEVSFFTRYHIEDMKSIKHKTIKLRNIIQCVIMLLQEHPKRVALADGTIQYDYVSVFTQILVKNKFLSKVKDLKKYSIPAKVLLQIDELLRNKDYNLSLDQVQNTNKGLKQLLLWIKAILTINKMLNPLIFISTDYLKNRCTKDEMKFLEYIHRRLEDWKTIYSLRVHSNNKRSSFKQIIERAQLTLSKDFTEYLSISRDSNIPTNIHQFYFHDIDEVPFGAKSALFEKVLTEFFRAFDQYEETNANRLVHHMPSEPLLEDSFMAGKENKRRMLREGERKHVQEDRNQRFDSEEANHSDGEMSKMKKIVREETAINPILDNLEIEIICSYFLPCMTLAELHAASVLNTHWNHCVKVHLNLRVYVLIHQTKGFENRCSHIANQIHMKRAHFYQEYERPPPSKDHAIQNINKLTNKDICHLKTLHKPSHKFELFVTPFLILFEIQDIKKQGFWKAALRFFQKIDIFTKITDYHLETISSSLIQKITPYVNKSDFSVEAAKKINASLGNLVSWTLGVYEFHQFLRKFSLTNYDYDLLSEEEIKFGETMDSLILRNFKLLRFVHEHCEDYKDYQFIQNQIQEYQS